MGFLLQIALRYLGIKYKYGGKNPVSGFDCSGFVSEILKACGVVPHFADWNSQQLYDNLEKNANYDRWGLGSLAFFGKDSHSIEHVAFCIDQYIMIESAGGDHLTLTTDDAIAKNACVRIRPIKYRKDFLFVMKPDYSKIGIVS